MRIIISPAKKMVSDTDSSEPRGVPVFIEETERLLEHFRRLSYEEAKAVWKCNDAIATQNYERFQRMELQRGLSPALFCYEGIQYQYMAPGAFDTEELAYVQEHLRILSGFYGMVRPLDGIVPYRLEMQAKWGGPDSRSLYTFWGRKLADQLRTESDCVLNLASKEYSKCITPYSDSSLRVVTCVFGQLVDGKVVEKSPYVKIARGEMVRYLAEHRVKSVEDARGFNRDNYRFVEELSDANTYVFAQPQP